MSNPGTGRRRKKEARNSVPEVFITHAGHLVIDSKYSENQDNCDISSQDKEDVEVRSYKKKPYYTGQKAWCPDAF